MTTVYKATVYIFTWRKEKNDSSKPLGMDIWVVAPPPHSLFVPLPFNIIFYMPLFTWICITTTRYKIVLSPQRKNAVFVESQKTKAK